MTTVRRIDPAEIARIGEIDRSERIAQQYRSRDGTLELVDTDIDAPRWGEPGEHPVQHYVDGWTVIAGRDGAVVFGAFEDDRLVGVAIFDPSHPDGSDIGNLAVLHVSREVRRTGVGRLLSDAVLAAARDAGAARLYVSATPTRATVDFYRSLGFEPLATPDPAMFAREPYDIHLERPP